MTDESRPRELTPEEFASLAPSDRAHYRIKGRFGDGSDDLESDASKTARAAAFKLDPIHDPEAVDLDERREALESAKKEAGVGASQEEPSVATDDGITPPEGSGHPQSEEEAEEAEKNRREEMSEAEKAEAEERDEFARDMPTEPHDENADIPNLGSRHPESDENPEE